MSLRLVPVTFGEAAAFVGMWHRHLRPPRATSLAHSGSTPMVTDTTTARVDGDLSTLTSAVTERLESEEVSS